MRLILSAALLAALLSSGAQAQQSQLADPQQQQQGQKATQTPAGKAGTEEPSAHIPTDRPQDMAPLVQGRWNVPTAPADSQTVPAKFSERNAYIDSLPTMAAALIWLNDSDRQQIAAALRADNAPLVQLEAAPAEELSGAFELRDLPKAVTDAWPGLAGYSYLRTADRAVIVREPNSVVVGEIPLANATTGSAK